MDRSEEVQFQAERMAAMLGRLGRLAWTASAYQTRNLAPGEFRSPYRFPTGFELDVPRAFTVDDDPRSIDTRHVPPSLAVGGLGEAILREDMRLVQAVHRAEAPFVAVLDLSRSMLFGCLDGPPPTDPADPTTTKLQALFVAAGAFLKLAEPSGFVTRAVYLHGRTPEEHRAAARHFTQQVLQSMVRRLADSYRRAVTDHDDREDFLLAAGLKLSLARRRRGIVVVVSDFLDPFDSYAGPLTQVMALHQVVLVDVATHHDRNYPVGRWYDILALGGTSREGARHLENGTRERSLAREEIEKWNANRQADRRNLETLARRHNVHIVPAIGLSFRKCYLRAFAELDRFR